MKKQKCGHFLMNLLSWSISRVLSLDNQFLSGDKLLCRSSNLPELWTGHPLSSYLVLLRVEFTFAARCYQRHGVLLPHPFTLTVFTAVCSLLHWSSAHAARTLSGTLPFVARTFLSFTCPTRSCEHG